MRGVGSGAYLHLAQVISASKFIFMLSTSHLQEAAPNRWQNFSQSMCWAIHNIVSLMYSIIAIPPPTTTSTDEIFGRNYQPITWSSCWNSIRILGSRWGRISNLFSTPQAPRASRKEHKIQFLQRKPSRIAVDTHDVAVTNTNCVVEGNLELVIKRGDIDNRRLVTWYIRQHLRSRISGGRLVSL